MVAPFDPVTVLLTVALNRCPTRFVLVHTRELDVSVISDPAGMLPTLDLSEPLVPFVTVFPLAVVVGALVEGRVVVRGGVLTVEPELRGGVRVTGALATGPDVAGAPAAGTSWSAGWAALS
jgi:hypothetical protein